MQKTIYHLILILIFWGCSTTKQIGQKELVSSSGNKESWVKTDEIFWEEDEKLFFKSIVTNISQLEVGLRQGKAELMKNISEKISLTVNSELSQAFAGTNLNKREIDRYIEDVINWTITDLRISGVTPSKMYWEEYQVNEAYGVTYVYDIYLLGYISSADFNYAYIKALENLEKLDDKYAKNVAKELIDKLKSKIK